MEEHTLSEHMYMPANMNRHAIPYVTAILQIQIFSESIEILRTFALLIVKPADMAILFCNKQSFCRA